jgi:predicted RNase H-like HicB family nuclease
LSGSYGIEWQGWVCDLHERAIGECLMARGENDMLQYHAAYYSIEDGWFMVRVLEFPGVISQGRSIQHARTMIKDALCLMAEYKLDQGEVLPRPNPKARDKKAVLIEPIKLKLQVQVGTTR